MKKIFTKEGIDSKQLTLAVTERRIDELEQENAALRAQLDSLTPRPISEAPRDIGTNIIALRNGFIIGIMKRDQRANKAGVTTQKYLGWRNRDQFYFDLDAEISAGYPTHFIPLSALARMVQEVGE